MRGNLVNITKLDIDHLVPYLELVNNSVVTETTNPGEKDFKIYTQEEIKNWLITRGEESDRVDFAIVENTSNEFIGEVVLNHIENQSANIRIAILPKFFDKGYGTEAMSLAMNYGKDKLSLKEITLGVYDINPRGKRVYEKLGFKQTKIEEENGHKHILMKKSLVS